MVNIQLERFNAGYLRAIVKRHRDDAEDALKEETAGTVIQVLEKGIVVLTEIIDAIDQGLTSELIANHLEEEEAVTVWRS